MQHWCKDSKIVEHQRGLCALSCPSRPLWSDISRLWFFSVLSRTAEIFATSSPHEVISSTEDSEWAVAFKEVASFCDFLLRILSSPRNVYWHFQLPNPATEGLQICVIWPSSAALSPLLRHIKYGNCNDSVKLQHFCSDGSTYERNRSVSLIFSYL